MRVTWRNRHCTATGPITAAGVPRATSKGTGLRTRWAAWTLAASLVGPAFAAPASACSRVAGIEMQDCATPEPKPARTVADLEAEMFSLVNEAREASGLRAYRPDARAARIARDQAAAMARRGQLFHNPKMGSRSGRRSLGLPGNSGENVGVGPSVRAVHRAFMDSGGHRGQVLARSFRRVGIGVARGGNQLWISQVFVGSGSGGSRSASTASAPSGARQPAQGVILPGPAALPDDATEILPLAAQPGRQGFPWLALTPGAITVGTLLLRRRRQRRAWS